MPSLVESTKPSKIKRRLPSAPADAPKLFDLSVRKINPTWVNPANELEVPANPLHVKAHQLQQMIRRVEKAAELHPQALNVNTYLSMLNEFTRLSVLINEGLDKDPKDENVDEGKVADNQHRSKAAPGVGEAIASSVDPGISADNPLTGKGSDNA